MRRLGATLRGFGSYHISNNSILKGGMSPPMITNSVSNGAVIVRHREYLRDIQFNTDQSFNIDAFQLNPGLQKTFPWLSQIAPAFQQYRFRGLVFEYKTLSADVTTSTVNSGLGSVVLATQYNALDTPFTNKYEMENWEFSTSCKPSLSCLHPVECAKGQTPVSLLWVRTGIIPQNADERLYDLGNFNIATVGIPGTTSTGIGELWVSYEIEFFKPQFNEDATTSSVAFTWSNQLGTSSSNPQWGGFIKTLPFGSLPPSAGSTIYPERTVNNSNWPGDIHIDVAAQFVHILDVIGKRILVNIAWTWVNGGMSIGTPAANTDYVAVNTLQGCRLVKYGFANTNQGYAVIQDRNLGAGAPSAIFLSFMLDINSDNAGFNLKQYTWTGATNNTADFFTMTITEVGPNFGGLLI